MWDSLRACNSAFLIDVSTVPHCTLGQAFASLHSPALHTIEDDPVFGGHISQQLPEDSELIELENKWLQPASHGSADPIASGNASTAHLSVSSGRSVQELLLPEGVLAKIMDCLTNCDSESEATVKASSILAKVLADRCVFDSVHGISAVSSCLHEIMLSNFFSSECCFVILYNISAHLAIMDCNSMQLSEQLLAVLHSLLVAFWTMTRRVPTSSHSSLSKQIRRAWSCAANLFVHFVTAGGLVIQSLITTSSSLRSVFVLVDAARMYGLSCHSAFCRLLFLSVSGEPEQLLSLVDADSTLAPSAIQISDHARVLGWLLTHMSHCPVGQSRDCLFVLVFKIVIVTSESGQEPLDVAKSNALLAALLQFRLSSVLHVYSGHFPTEYSESICRWLFKALRSHPVDSFDKRSAIDFFCSVERVARHVVDVHSASSWPALLFDLPPEELASELHALSVAELRVVESYLCQLWFHHCELADTSTPSRETRPFFIIKVLSALRHHMACAFLAFGLLKYSVSYSIFRSSRGSTVEHGLSCSFELINDVFVELFVPSDPASPPCYDAVLSGFLDLVSKLIMVHPVDAESPPLSLDSSLPALFLKRKLQVPLSVTIFVFPNSLFFVSFFQIPLSRLQLLHPAILQVVCSNIPCDLLCYRRTCAIMAVSLASLRFG
jgi:hypothetical protein